MKTYAGPELTDRIRREQLALTRLAGLVPTPALVGHGPNSTTTAYVDGRPGQDGFTGARAVAVLRACGVVLQRLHDLDPAVLFHDDQLDGRVIVHGDFGPNNVLLDDDARQVVAVVDWEWAHPGDPIEDLAWCEWIVRTHHPEETAALSAFFAAYGARPTWAERRARIVRAHERLIDLCERWEADGRGVDVWRERLARTRTWSALPDDPPDAASGASSGIR